jgi:catechol 2,3-dioxygenase-like lactoylglutathione lyase family enzyme
VIKGVHTMFFSSEPEALREFLRDKLGFDSFTDVGGGWLIFDLPEADMGVHPADPSGSHGQPAGSHDVSFYCDDIQATVADLKGRGVVFEEEVIDAGFGFTTRFAMPGGVNVQLYQPHYRKGSG